MNSMVLELSILVAELWIMCQYAKCCGTSNRKRSTSYFLSYMYNKACRTANKISLYTRHCCTCTPNTAVLLIRIWRFFLQGRKSGGFYFKTRKTYENKKVAGCQSAKPKHLLGKKKNNSPFGPKPKENYLFFLPKRCLALRFTTNCKEAVCPDLT